MIAAEKIVAYLEKYGSRVTLIGDENLPHTSFYAMVQPLRYKNKMYLEGIRTPIGYTQQSYYLYVGPADVDVTRLTVQNTLEMGGRRFYFSHAEAVCLSGDTLYMWGILRPEVLEEVA